MRIWNRGIPKDQTQFHPGFLRPHITDTREDRHPLDRVAPYNKLDEGSLIDVSVLPMFHNAGRIHIGRHRIQRIIQGLLGLVS
ncbi:hypothetical protein TNCV_137141 [Trichonephila clavipes]|nr:hypothetical protein TNCV_137141 [Trichonephila clavipes]